MSHLQYRLMLLVSNVAGPNSYHYIRGHNKRIGIIISITFQQFTLYT